MYPLDGCRAKVERARMHVGEFADGVRGFTDRAPYKILGEHDTSTNELVFSAEADPEFPPVPIDLVLIAGEVVHQLRSALDHLVWQLVLANTGRPPRGTRSGFPIFLTEAGYVKRAPQMITGVSSQAEKRIRGAQPFHVGPEAASVLTWFAHELNNMDKHRLTPALTAYSFVGHVKMTTSDGKQEFVLPPAEYVREPLQDGMEIARVPATDARFDIPVGFDVAFEEVGGVRDHPATGLLGRITNDIGGLVESFRGEFPVTAKAHL